jgi:hypothetical protein
MKLEMTIWMMQIFNLIQWPISSMELKVPKRGPHTFVCLLLKLMSGFHSTLQLIQHSNLLGKQKCSCFPKCKQKSAVSFMVTWAFSASLSIGRNTISFCKIKRKDMFVSPPGSQSLHFVLFLGQEKDHPN